MIRATSLLGLAMLLAGCRRAFDNAKVGMGSHHAHRLIPVGEASTGTVGAGGDNHNASRTGERGCAGIVGTEVGGIGCAGEEPPPARAHHACLREKDRPCATEQGLAGCGSNLAWGYQRESASPIDAQVALAHKPQVDIAWNTVRARDCGGSGNHQRNRTKANTSDGRPDIVGILAIETLKILMQLNRGGEARIIHQVPTHIQVLGEREHKALCIVHKVVELRIQVRAE